MDRGGKPFRKGVKTEVMDGLKRDARTDESFSLFGRGKVWEWRAQWATNSTWRAAREARSDLIEWSSILAFVDDAEGVP